MQGVQITILCITALTHYCGCLTIFVESVIVIINIDAVFTVIDDEIIRFGQMTIVCAYTLTQQTFTLHATH